MPVIILRQDDMAVSEAAGYMGIWEAISTEEKFFEVGWNQGPRAAPPARETPAGVGWVASVGGEATSPCSSIRTSVT